MNPKHSANYFIQDKNSEGFHLANRQTVCAHREVLACFPPSIRVSLKDIDVAPLDIDANVIKVQL